MLDITVGCLITYKDSLVMVYEEQDGKFSWDIPAGHLKQDESPKNAVYREVQEETGIDIRTNGTLEFCAIFYHIVNHKIKLHFLYAANLDILPELVPGDSDIKAIELKDRPAIQAIIKNKEYEHDLARRRLETYLYNNSEPKVFPLEQIGG